MGELVGLMLFQDLCVPLSLIQSIHLWQAKAVFALPV
jgi:hypothetical protein